MTEHTDYSKWSLKKLLEEEKRIKKSEFYSALAIGFLAGIMLFGLVMNGFGLIYTVIPIFFIYLIVRNSKNSKENRRRLQVEIESRKPG